MQRLVRRKRRFASAFRVPRTERKAGGRANLRSVSHPPGEALFSGYRARFFRRSGAHLWNFIDREQTHFHRCLEHRRRMVWRRARSLLTMIAYFGRDTPAPLKSIQLRLKSRQQARARTLLIGT